MRKIVPRLLVVSSQILLGALFFVFTINGKNEISLKVNSQEMDKLSKFVYKENKVVTDVVSESIEYEKEKKEEKKIVEQKQEFVKEENIIEKKQEEKVEDKYFMSKEVLSSYVGTLTGYGPDCYGCGNYNTNKVSTSSGYHIADIVDGLIQPAFTVTYNDNEFGEVRIVAGDSTLPYNSIVRIMIPSQEPIIAIVLDRGSTVGFESCKSSSGCLTTFDLLFPTESQAMGKTNNVTFEILRMGV